MERRGERGRGGVGLLWVVACALVPNSPAAAQQVVPQRGQIATDTEVDSVSGFRLGVEATVAPMVGGEAFGEMGAGLGLALVSTIDFGDVVSADVSVAASVHTDDLADQRARLIDIIVHPRWTIDRVPTGLTFGPILGVTWFRRADFEEWARGFHAGAGLRFEGALGARWAVVARAAATWAGFSQLPLPSVPLDPDGSSYGSRGTLGLGLARRLGGR